jgi:hypothetical protein
MNTNATLNEINREAFDLLYKEFGICKTLRFISQFTLGKGDYTKWKEDIYKGKTVDDLVNKIKSKK